MKDRWPGLHDISQSEQGCVVQEEPPVTKAEQEQWLPWEKKKQHLMNLVRERAHYVLQRLLEISTLNLQLLHVPGEQSAAVHVAEFIDPNVEGQF